MKSNIAASQQNRFHIFFKENIYTVVSLALFILFWEVAVKIMKTPDFILPAPSLILEATIKNNSYLYVHSLSTLKGALLGFGYAVAIGVPLAILIVYVPVMEKTIFALLVSANAVPKVALAPILVVWFGLGMTPKIIVTFLICFFPIVINTVLGMQSISREMLYLARSLGATSSQQFLKFRLPKALPSIFGGFKIAITLAVVGTVVGEYVAAGQGLGYAQVVAAGYLRTPLVFSILVILSIMGIVLFNLIHVVERFVVKGDPNTVVKKSIGK